MSHADHLTTVIQCMAEDKPVPLCPECHAIVDTFTVAGDPIKMETWDDQQS